MTLADIDLPPDAAATLKALAETTGRPQHLLVRDAVLEYLADLGDVPLAVARREAIAAGAAQPVSLEEVERRLGLAH